jgi:hypothetical protein
MLAFEAVEAGVQQSDERVPELPQHSSPQQSVPAETRSADWL